MSTAAENPDQYSTKHEHEPEIPPTLDEEGRCRVCGLLVKLEAAVRERDDSASLNMKLELENDRLDEAVALLREAKVVARGASGRLRWYKASSRGDNAKKALDELVEYLAAFLAKQGAP